MDMKKKAEANKKFGVLTTNMIEAAKAGDPLAQILLAPHVTIKKSYNVMAQKYNTEKEN